MLLYRTEGDISSAEVDYKKIIQAFQLQPNIYNFAMPKMLQDELCVPDTKARLNVISFAGLSPVKEEVLTSLYVAGSYCRVAVPVMLKRKSSINSVLVKATNLETNKVYSQEIEKIESFASDEQAKILHSQVYVDNRPKCKNEEIYYTIHYLDEAITNKVKVNVTYSRRKITDEFKTASEDKTYTVSPYALIWSDDHYYLVCNNEKYDNLMHLRVEKIKKFTLTKEPVRPFTEVSNLIAIVISILLCSAVKLG